MILLHYGILPKKSNAIYWLDMQRFALTQLSVFNIGSSPKELILIKDSRIPGVQGSSEMKWGIS